MFLENSRYHQQATVEVTLPDDRTALALKLRKLPTTEGSSHIVQQHDRLDVLAQQTYADGTKFWHVADGNAELQANDLVAEPGASLNLPEQ